MSENNVIPFRPRRPSENELEAYRHITRNWSPEMRQLMFPQLEKEEERRDGRVTK